MTVKNRIFQSPKMAYFLKGVNLCFWPRNAIFLLEIMLSDFEEKKETFFDDKKQNFIYKKCQYLVYLDLVKKQNFSKFKKSHFFQRV